MLLRLMQAGCCWSVGAVNTKSDRIEQSSDHLNSTENLFQHTRWSYWHSTPSRVSGGVLRHKFLPISPFSQEGKSVVIIIFPLNKFVDTIGNFFSTKIQICPLDILEFSIRSSR